MVNLDHFSLATKDVYEAAYRLRAETKLGFYDGGWTETGIGSKIFPLGGSTYLMLEGIVNPFSLADKNNPGAKRFYDGVASGEGFRGWSLRVDSMEELQQIAKERNFKSVVLNKNGGRIRPNGDRVIAAGTPSLGDSWPMGLPNWNFFAELQFHPSGQPASRAPGLAKPQGISWIEVGGTEPEMTKWLAMPASKFPIRFNGKAAGLYAVAVNSDKGEIVIRRNPLSES
jgi:Glyoxalase-like domain